MKILADAHIPYLSGVIEQFGEVEYLPGNLFSHETIKDKDALFVRTVTRFDEKILAGTDVKLICSATIGYDHIDTQYCSANNIAWRTAPGCNANSVEQYVTASLLMLADKYKFDLSEKTIGIIGVGNVGSRVKKTCQTLGMRVLLNDPPLCEKNNKLSETDNFVDIETIKQKADIITLHTPLTKTGKHKTYHLADEPFFDSLNKKPFIINTSRGDVVCTTALKNTLKSGKISGAVIDCWKSEPNIDLELLEMVFIATPHIAGYSADGKWMATKMSLDNFTDFFSLKSLQTELKPLQQPDNPIIDLSNIKKVQQLAFSVWKTYNPMNDTYKLKANPDKFTWFRSNYPLRREYLAYEVINADTEVAETLTKMGFKQK